MFGSQLNLKTVSSEFDDLPGFVSGRVAYFVKEMAAQPFSVLNKKIQFQLLFNCLHSFPKVYSSDVGSAEISNEFFKYHIAKRRLGHVTPFLYNG